MNATDLVAEHYFPDDGGWTRPGHVFGADVAEHQKLMTEIHRRVAHLSTQRYTVKGEGAFEWQTYVRAQFPLLPAAFAGFLAALRSSPDQRPMEWFRRTENLMVFYRLLPR